MAVLRIGAFDLNVGSLFGRSVVNMLALALVDTVRFQQQKPGF